MDLSDKNSIQLPKIKNKEDLSRLFKYLNEQGFGYFSDWEPHQRKVSDLINKNNTLNVKFDDKFKSEMIRLEDYDEIEKQTKAFFSKFSTKDKIFELLNNFYISSDESCNLPSRNSPDIKQIINWIEFKKKYNLKDTFEHSGWNDSFIVYNLDKNILKIKFGESYDFKTLYKLIFNEEISVFNSNIMGEWQDIGKIEIKLFQNGYANIKGDLTVFREYYYIYTTKKPYQNTIIKYKGKQEIFKISRKH